MTTDVTGGINFQWNLIDNISATSAVIEGSQVKLGASVQNTTAAIDHQNISFMTTLAAVRATYMGMTRLIGGAEALGIVHGQLAVELNKVRAGADMVYGTFMLWKGISKGIDLVTESSISLAAVQSYLAIIANPLAIGLIAAGIGVAVGAGVALSTRSGHSSTTNVTQNLTFTSMASQTTYRSTSQDSLAAMGGL